jgi:SAM-dependent methyltransferase
MSFDAIAPHYRWMEFLTAGERLQRCRTRFLDELPVVRRALVLGPGVGRFLPELLRRQPGAQVTCVDASGRMLELVSRRVQKRGFALGRIQLVQSDILEWLPSAEPFDLVASHFFLDCFPPDQLARVISIVSASTAPGACWLVSDFREPERGWRRLRARAVLKAMYLFFRWFAKLPASHLTDPTPMLAANGFTLERRHLSHFGLLHADLWKKPA